MAAMIWANDDDDGCPRVDESMIEDVELERLAIAEQQADEEFRRREGEVMKELRWSDIEAYWKQVASHDPREL